MASAAGLAQTSEDGQPPSGAIAAMHLLSFDDWVHRYRMIRDKSTGRTEPFVLDDYPWMTFVYNCIGNLKPNGRVVLRKAAQIGATELALNLAFWVLDGRGNVFYALPPGPVQGNFAHARVDPSIDASPHLREIAGNIDNVGLKTFAGGFNLYIRGTAVPQGKPTRAAQLSEAPADLAVVDEFDRVPPAAIPLIRDRLGDSWLKWEIDLSTPTYPGLGIDAEYHESTMHEAQIKCQACGEWHWLDWTLVVGPDYDSSHARVICPACHAAIDRTRMWADGRAQYVARAPDNEVMGVWISKLCSERADIDKLWARSRANADTDVQAFWNSDMGLPYEPKGARLTKDLIAACASAPEVYPTFPDRATWTAMGVDIGIEIHYWIKERRPDGRERAVSIGSVLDWSELDALMIRYGVQRCVVDDRPELREDEAFSKRFRGKVWLGLEEDNPDADMVRWDRGKVPPRVHIERTKALDEASVKIQTGVDELPADWESIPDLVEHMTVSTKAKRVLDDGSTRYYFPNTGKPDHLHHAKAFCEVAMRLLERAPLAGEDSGVDEAPQAGASRYQKGVPAPGRKPGSMRGTL